MHPHTPNDPCDELDDDEPLGWPALFGVVATAMGLGAGLVMSPLQALGGR